MLQKGAAGQHAYRLTAHLDFFVCGGDVFVRRLHLGVGATEPFVSRLMAVVRVVDVIVTVAPGTPPRATPGLTVSPRVGTVYAGVSRPRVGREAPGWGGPSWREPPRGGA